MKAHSKWNPLLTALFLAPSAVVVSADTPCGSWVQVAPPVFQGEPLMMHDVVVFGPASASGFGVTYQPNGIDPASIILTHWDGVAWQVVDEVDLMSGAVPGVPRGVAALDGSGPDNLWFAGTFDPAGFVFARPFLAHWDGSSWSFHYPSSDGGDPMDMAYVSDNLIYLIGGNATPWVWDGVSLSLFSPFPPVSVGQPQAYDAVPVGAGAFWIGGHQSADIPPPSGLSLWHWDGSQWNEYLDSDVNFLTGDALVESHVYGLDAVAADDAWAVGDKQLLAGGVFSTYLHWDGDAWTEVPGPQEIGPAVIAAVASDDVWAFGGLSASDELLFAHWDGMSWSLTPQGTLPGATAVGTGLFEMVADADCNGWALGRYSTDGGATFSPLLLQLQPGGGPVLGDLNCDGVVNAFDIDPFILALTDPAGYAAQYPDCDLMAADINDDGVVNAFDIDPFIALLTGK